MFKVGDKYERIGTSSQYFNKGNIYEISIVSDSRVAFIDNQGNTHWWPKTELNDTFKSVLPSKKQRITTLEETVAELQKALGEQIKWNDKQAEFNDSVIKKLTEIYQAITSENEVIEDKQEVQHQTVPCTSVKTPNELRAEIIEKAKGFESKVERSPSCKYIKFDVFECIVEYVVNAEKRTVVALLRGYSSGRVRGRGFAKCNPSDVFNEHIGKAIALGRALGLDVSEFEQAVQPTELVVGHVTTHADNRNYGPYTVDKLDGKYAWTGGTYWRRNEPLDSIRCKIINDTNAIYGGVE